MYMRCRLLMAGIGVTNTFPKAGKQNRWFMTPNQIEMMIDRIVALFPASQVPRNTIKTGWVQDDFLIKASLEEGRKALDVLRETCVKFPSLKEVHRAFLLVRGTRTEEVLVGCELCDGSGWDTGITLDRPLGYRQVADGKEYSYVKKCVCSS